MQCQQRGFWVTAQGSMWSHRKGFRVTQPENKQYPQSSLDPFGIGDTSARQMDSGVIEQGGRWGPGGSGVKSLQEGRKR